MRRSRSDRGGSQEIPVMQGRIGYSTSCQLMTKVFAAFALGFASWTLTPQCPRGARLDVSQNPTRRLRLETGQKKPGVLRGTPGLKSREETPSRKGRRQR